jgi:dTDP-4-amino-4,6-dideoxygalactose transaminase
MTATPAAQATLDKRATYLHVPLIQPDIPPLEKVADDFREILANGKITNFGKFVTQFEKEIGEYLGVPAVTTSSGTMALLFALQSLGLRPGEKVIVPSFTFMATVQAILYAGAVPVFAEIGDDLTLQPAELEMLLEKHPDARTVIAVHMYGLPCEVDGLQAVVDAFERKRAAPIKLLYDAAHAFGSRVGNRKVGSFGYAEVFSLSVTKVLVSVEGGLVVSRDAKFLQRVRQMRNYGIESNYNAVHPGMNGKMSEFHAIVGLQSLRNIDSLMERRQKLAARYFAAIESQTSFRRLPQRPGVVHTYKDFSIVLPDRLVARRPELIELLKERGIETRAYFFPPVHEQGHFRKWADRPLPRTESLSRRVLTLPFFTSMTDEQVDHVVDSLAHAEKALA